MEMDFTQLEVPLNYVLGPLTMQIVSDTYVSHDDGSSQTVATLIDQTGACLDHRSMDVCVLALASMLDHGVKQIRQQELNDDTDLTLQQVFGALTVQLMQMMYRKGDVEQFDESTAIRTAISDILTGHDLNHCVVVLAKLLDECVQDQIQAWMNDGKALIVPMHGWPTSDQEKH